MMKRLPKTHFDILKEHNIGALHFLDEIRRTGLQVEMKGGSPGGILQYRGVPTSTALLAEVLWKYEMFGQQNYVVGPALENILLHTHLKQIPKEAIILPYPCFYIHLEDSDIEVWGGLKTLWHKCGGLYVYQSRNKIFVVIWGKKNKRSKTIGDDAQSWLSFDIEEIFSKHENLEDYVEWIVKNGDEVLDTSWLRLPGENTERFIVNCQKACRIVFNLLMYLQVRNLEIEISTPQSREEEFKKNFGKRKLKGRARLAKRDLERAGKHTFTFLERTREASQRGSGRSITQSFWVSGHWQRYWYGPKDSRRQEWVLKEPYIKGEGPLLKKRFYKSKLDVSNS